MICGDASHLGRATRFRRTFRDSCSGRRKGAARGWRRRRGGASKNGDMGWRLSIGVSKKLARVVAPEIPVWLDVSSNSRKSEFSAIGLFFEEYSSEFVDAWEG